MFEIHLDSKAQMRAEADDEAAALDWEYSDHDEEYQPDECACHHTVCKWCGMPINVVYGAEECCLRCRTL